MTINHNESVFHLLYKTLHLHWPSLTNLVLYAVLCDCSTTTELPLSLLNDHFISLTKLDKTTNCCLWVCIAFFSVHSPLTHVCVRIAQTSTLQCVMLLYTVWFVCVDTLVSVCVCVLLQFCDRPDLEKHWDRELRLSVRWQEEESERRRSASLSKAAVSLCQ